MQVSIPVLLFIQSKNMRPCHIVHEHVNSIAQCPKIISGKEKLFTLKSRYFLFLGLFDFGESIRSNEKGR